MRAGLWNDKCACVLSIRDSFLTAVPIVAAMAVSLQGAATRAVLIRTSVVYVVCICCPGQPPLIHLIQLLASQGAGDTLSYMKRYWVDYHGQDEHFWEVWLVEIHDSPTHSFLSMNGITTGLVIPP
jgi:hypothetical protein